MIYFFSALHQHIHRICWEIFNYVKYVSFCELLSCCCCFIQDEVVSLLAPLEENKAQMNEFSVTEAAKLHTDAKLERCPCFLLSLRNSLTGSLQ